MIIDLADVAKEAIKYTMDDILNEVQKNKSYVGMIITSRTLDTEEKVKNFYGGEKWERIRGRTLVGAADDFPIGTEGGEKEHVLSWDEMPRHSHNLTANAHFTVANNQGCGRSAIPSEEAGWGSIWKAHWYTLWIEDSGNSRPHNNMPPYTVCYIWERIE